MIYTIYTAEGARRTDFEGNSNSTHDHKVQTNNELSLSFTLHDYVELNVNDYVEIESMRFVLMKPYRPLMKSTKEYVYDVKFYGPENIAGTAIFLDTDYNPISSYYDTPSAQLAYIVSCINRVIGRVHYHVGEVISSEPVKVEYTRGSTCLEALSVLSTTCKTEWWLDGVNFNLSKCEHGTPVSLGYGMGLLKLEKELTDTDDFFTRLLPTGSSKNIIAAKYGHNTLQLPGGKKWIDRNVDLYGIKERWEESAFADIFPRFTGTVGTVRAEQRTIEGTEVVVYYFKSPDIPFNPNEYSVANTYKHVVFKSGDLLGQDFEANWNESTAEWELITQYPTELTQLPGDNIIPRTGDKYTVYNLNMPDEYYPLAEQEYEEAVNSLLDDAAIDYATYKGPTDSVFLEDNNLSLSLGRRVRLNSDIYFADGYRESRITRIVRKLSNLNDMDIEISNTIIKGQYAQMKSDVIDLKNNFSQTLANEILNIIRTDSSADLSDTNVLSSLRSLKEIKERSIKEIKNRALSRLNADKAAGHIEFEEGITVKTPSNSVTNRKSIAPALIEEGEPTEFLSRNITEVSDDYDAEAQAISLGAVEVSSGGVGAATVGELDNVDESFDTCPDGIYSWQKKGQVFFPIKGTTGGGSSKMALSFISPSSLVVVYGGDAVIRYGFTSILDDEPTGAGTATYTVNNKVVYSATVEQGEISFNAGKYLLQGENALVISVTDVYGNVRRLTYNINAANISLTSTFDNSRVYSGGISFAYTPVGAVEKVVHFILDGIEIGTVTTTASNRQQSYAIPSQTHGAHSLEVYMTATIDGAPIESNHLFYEFISIKEGNNTPVIASSFRETDAEQFSTIVVPYMVYNPTATMADITLSANGNIVSTQSVNRTPQTWSYRTVDSGALALKIACGSVSRTFNLTVSESDIDVNAETADLVLFLTSINRSNNEEGRNIWNYQEIYALLTAFNWATNGWIKTIEGFVALRINGDARVTIPYNSFAGDFRATGKTLEFEFETRDVTDYDKVILSCMNGGIGLQVTAQSAVFKSRQTTITTQFKEDERVRVSFVVEKRVENRLIYVYINGEMCGVVQYPEQDDFTQSNPVGISIGSDACTTDIFNIRVYDNNLNRYQLLDNYLADMDNLEVKKGLFADNNIYDDYGNVSYNKVVDKIPALTIIGRLPAYKGDKVTCQMAYEDKQNPNRSWTCNSVQNDVQGTSSQYYPRKNYKFKFKSSLTMQDGSTADKFAVREGEIPVNCFCTKADFAEASGCHNTGMARMVDFVLRGLGQLTPPQKTDSRVRTTIDGYPIVIFHKETEDSEPAFLGKYNFNNDKSTQETFGFTPGCECWEILNNTSNRVLFKTSDYTTEEWKKDFEARYPEDYTDNTKLKRLTDWLASVQGNPTKFKQEASQYLDIPFILSYYILTEFFAMVDQRAKNMFLTTFDGIHWFSIFYDNDTCLGINNEGVNAFDFTVEYHDKLGTQDVWNGEQSTLWNNVEQAYATEISTMYAEMRKNGLLTYEQCDYYLNQEQCDKWSASIYNEDGWFKYVMPLLEEDNGSYLYAAQGSRKMHRIWWLYNRFKYMDSRYIAGDYMNDFATMRLYTPTSWEGVEPNANITLTSYVGQYINVKYGSYIVGSHAKKNVPVTIQAPDIRFNDTETIIYGASQISSLGDLSALYAGTVDVSKMDKLTELIVGSGVSGYKNTNLTVLSVGANNLLRKLDVRNCPNLTQAIDVSKCGGIREIWAEGTGITGISLPEGGNLTLLHLPDTITNLTLRNQAHLESAGLVIGGMENLKSIRWENCLADALPVIIRCLSIEFRQLERLRILGADWNMPTLDILDTLSQMGGLDENGNNVPRAVITGKLHVISAHKEALDKARANFPELTITYDNLIETTRTITIYGTGTTSALVGAEVTINGNKYIADSAGKVSVKTTSELNISMKHNGYVSKTATFPASVANTAHTVYLDKIVTFTMKVTLDSGDAVLGAKVTYGGVSKTTGSDGVAVFDTSAGSYSWTVEYDDNVESGTATISQSNVSESVIFVEGVEGYRPTPNGNIQMMLNGQSVSLTVNSTTSDYIINWKDGTTTNATGTGSVTYTHDYLLSGRHQVEVQNCAEVTSCNSTGSYLEAYWTIGDSKVNNLKFMAFKILRYVGEDLFRNDSGRTSMSWCFSDCKRLTSIPSGLFDSCPNVTDFSGCFYNCSSLQLFESKVTKVDNYMFNSCSSLTLVQINNDTVTTLVYTNAFDKTNAALQIKVPANLVDSYKAATNWISLADKITAI